MIKLDPSTGIRIARRRRARRRAAARDDRRWTWSSRGRAARGRRPTRCCSPRRCAATATRFTRQDGVEEAVADHAAAARCAAARAPVREGQLGAGGRGRAARRARRLARARGWRHDRRRRARASRRPHRRARRRRRRSRRSRTTRSCRTATPAALVAPDGAIDWLCVPRVRLARACSAPCSTARRATSASARSASTSRPRACTSPGTNMLVTTWHTPGGWIVVRDALTMGPRPGEDNVTPHTRPPADDDADHMLVRTIECIDGAGRGRAGLRAGLRLRARRRRSGRSPTATATRPTPCGAGQTDAPAHRTWRSASRAAASAPATSCRPASGRSARCPGPRTWPSPQDVDDAQARLAATTRFWRNWLAGARIPDHRWREALAALGPDHQGPDLHADRRDRRRAHDLAARRRRAASATGTTATPGCATRPSRCRRCTG